MSEPVILRNAPPLHLVRKHKCDRDVKLHMPTSLHDDIAQLARADNRTVGEYIRVILKRHVYDALSS